MTKLSVNINKVATLRNARGKNIPNLIKFAIDCQRFGAQGITIHPRPDERHIKYNDVFELKKVIYTEYNIEGYPSEKFIEIIKKVRPEQVTLVPDPPDVLTSNAGWDTIKNKNFLKEVISELKKIENIRVSIFIEPQLKMIENAVETGTDRVELYTEFYADNFEKDPKKAIKDYIEAAKLCKKLGLGINAGHDLNLHNLNFLVKSIPYIDEVSIGHALISDSLYYGIENVIQMYLNKLNITK